MKRSFAMALAAVALAISVSAWAYLSGSKTVTAQARELSQAVHAASLGNELTGAQPKPDPVAPFLQHVHSWAKRITFANAAAGLGLAALILIAAAGSQRQKNRAHAVEPRGRSALADPAVQQLHFEIANHLKERRRLEIELNLLKTDFEKRVETRTAAVSATYAQLEAELNQRKQSEKNLSQQRQELERSKDVLELHVQARTQQLQTLQRRYEHILNSAGEGIYGLDMTGKTTFVNPAAAKLTGYTVDELLGKTEHQTFLRTGDTQHTRLPGHDSAISPEALGPNTPIITSEPRGTSFTSFGGSHASGLANGTGEQTFRRKDGTAILVEYIRTPIIENGKQMGAVVTFKNITERKRAEETLARKAAELARSNAELEQFAYVASHDLQEPLRKIRAFGDRLKTTLDQLTAGQQSNDTAGATSASPASGNTQHRRRKKTSNGNTALIARDTPATTAAGTSSLPGGEGQGEGQTGSPAAAAKDYMQRMQNAAARMQTLINDLLTFSRVISTTQPFVPVDLGAVTREVLGDLELRIQQTGAQIHLGDLPTIHADPMQMRQLLQNIIANALKFQPANGRAAAPEAPDQQSDSPGGQNTGPHANGHVPQIHITAQLVNKPFASGGIGSHASGPDDQLCELSIQDNGIGFDEKYTDKIFAMFQRLHGRTEYEGTGVGLAVCRRITDRHSGTITAKSKPGEGATFLIRLPVHQVNKPEHSARAEAHSGPHASGLESHA